VIPPHLDWAFQEGRVVRTPGGTGRTTIRRLADLILPTGKVLIGFPGTPHINEPSKVRPAVAPGRYPVFASLAEHREGYRSVAFITVRFRDELPHGWEEAGQFFTDSGTGCLADEGSMGLLAASDSLSWEQWHELKMGVFGTGDCSLLLDPKTGTNAIVFKTFDWSYDCFLGKDRQGETVCLVIDGRWHRSLWQRLRWW
jgi:hypothetical protein